VALVAFLRGINVGGYRSFRPGVLARQLQHLEAVNIGAAGTFVIRAAIPRAQLRAELMGSLPFEAEIAICTDREVLRLVSRNPFTGRRARPEIVRFVSVLSRPPRATPSTPLRLPSRGRWLVRVLERENRFVIGLYRREMKVISCLGALDRLYGAPVVTRNWTTIVAIAGALNATKNTADTINQHG
jgi:uncharacterized protein (DUF1697 family)